MSAFTLTQKAKADLKAIAIYTQRHWGRDKRNQYLRQFDDCFHQLAENSSIGAACDYVKQGYRKFPQGSHLIYYRLAGNGLVEIIRILHKSMDVGARYFPE